jgi:5-aminolevulinate synthase
MPIAIKLAQGFDFQALVRQRLEHLQTQGNYRYFLPIEKSAAIFPEFLYDTPEGERRSAINFCSNDYLGQSTHPSVIAAMRDAAQKCGTGSGGTRNISGTTTLHRALEQGIADLVGKPAALIFNSAYLANQSVLTTLRRQIEGCIFISDVENHASIIEGIRACKAEKYIFRHNDMQHLEQILVQLPPNAPKIIVFESVYSMSGTVAPIEKIVRLAKKYHALTYCDEVHAVGLYAKNGAGLIAECGCTDDVDIINGTFAKAFGVVGGFVAGDAMMMDFLRSYAEGFIFTTSLPPSVCAAALESVRVVSSNPSILERFHNNVRTLRQIFTQKGIDFDDNPSHITRILIRDSKKCKQIADKLLHHFGVYLQPINFPTVPRGEECLRIIVSAKHTPKQMEILANALKEILA